MSDDSSIQRTQVLWVLSDDQRLEYDKEIRAARCAGVQFLHRSSPEDALEEIPELNPQLVVIGMSNDEMDGLEFLAFLMRPKLAFAGKAIVLPDRGDPYPPMLQWRDVDTGRSATEEITVEGLGDYVAALVENRGAENVEVKESTLSTSAAPGEALGAAVDFAAASHGSGAAPLPRKAEDASTVRPMRFPTPARPSNRRSGRLTDQPPTGYPGLVDHQAGKNSPTTPAPPPDVRAPVAGRPTDGGSEAGIDSGGDDFGAALAEELAEELDDAVGRLSQRLPAVVAPSADESESLPTAEVDSAPVAAAAPAGVASPTGLDSATEEPAEPPVPEPTREVAEPPAPELMRELAQPTAPEPMRVVAEVRPAAPMGNDDAKPRGMLWLAVAGIAALVFIAGAIALALSLMGEPSEPASPPAAPVGTTTAPEPPVDLQPAPVPEPPAAEIDPEHVEPAPPDEPEEPAPSASPLFSQTTLPLSFGPGSARFEVEDEPRMAEILGQLRAALEEAPDAVIEVGGHASDQGSSEVNRTLGRERAAQVRGYLVQHGFALERLVVRNYHTSNPTGEATDRALDMDRRVTIRLLD